MSDPEGNEVTIVPPAMRASPRSESGWQSVTAVSSSVLDPAGDGCAGNGAHGVAPGQEPDAGTLVSVA
jgi:hypothetical protein